MSHLLILTENRNETEQEAFKKNFEQEGLTCEIASLRVKAVLERLVKRPADLVLIDLTQSPTEDCLQVQRFFQSEPDFQNIPILFQLPRGEETRLDLSQGPSDFILKPYALSELFSRIRLMLWRHRRISGKETVRHGTLLIDLERYEVSLNDRRIDLTFKEYELLKFLATNPGKVFTRDSLLNKVWGYEYYGGTRTVDVHVRRLRSKIEDSAHQFIETVRSVGYKFLCENGIAQSPPKRPIPRKGVARKRHKKG